MISGDWSHLSTQQIGRMAEYAARMEFTRQGYRVYTPDVDDAGVDLLVHREDRGYLRVQVKASEPAITSSCGRLTSSPWTTSRSCSC